MADKRARFDQQIIRHIDAAHNFARWILKNDADAEDAVQEALIDAWKGFGWFQGSQDKAWFLAIVRNACYAQLRRSKRQFEILDDELVDDGLLPDALLLQNVEQEFFRLAIESLPEGYREVVILREMEDLSYAEISRVAGIPIGTVMSRLARGRAMLAKELTR